jgi:2-(1,2-epoxy-1,2-dihydrophenyl)acetyl-CoA isomerase
VYFFAIANGRPGAEVDGGESFRSNRTPELSIVRNRENTGTEEGLSMPYETILLEATDGVATVTLNRPDKLNAFVPKMHEELRTALDACAEDAAVRCIVLTGAGRGFCAGQDLAERAMQFSEGGAPDIGETLENFYNPLIRRLRLIEKPVVVAVNGVAAGAGANIALAGDIVIAARSAKFIEAFCKVGLIPDAGGTWSLPRLIGDARARGMALLGAPISAEQAAEWGLIWACVDDDELADEARAVARQLAAGPTRSLGLTKRALNASATNTLDEQLDLERDLQREAGRTEDYREGVAAFSEKRPAAFKGG